LGSLLSFRRYTDQPGQFGEIIGSHFSVNLKSSFLTPPHSIDRANSPMVWLLKRFCWLTTYTQWLDSATWRRGVFCATV